MSVQNYLLDLYLVKLFYLYTILYERCNIYRCTLSYTKGAGFQDDFTNNWMLVSEGKQYYYGNGGLFLFNGNIIVISITGSLILNPSYMLLGHSYVFKFLRTTTNDNIYSIGTNFKMSSSIPSHYSSSGGNKYLWIPNVWVSGAVYSESTVVSYLNIFYKRTYFLTGYISTDVPLNNTTYWSPIILEDIWLTFCDEAGKLTITNHISNNINYIFQVED